MAGFVVRTWSAESVSPLARFGSGWKSSRGMRMEQTQHRLRHACLSQPQQFTFIGICASEGLVVHGLFASTHGAEQLQQNIHAIYTIPSGQPSLHVVFWGRALNRDRRLPRTVRRLGYLARKNGAPRVEIYVSCEEIPSPEPVCKGDASGCSARTWVIWWEKASSGSEDHSLWQQVGMACF